MKLYKKLICLLPFPCSMLLGKGRDGLASSSSIVLLFSHARYDDRL